MNLFENVKLLYDKNLLDRRDYLYQHLRQIRYTYYIGLLNYTLSVDWITIVKLELEAPIPNPPSHTNMYVCTKKKPLNS